MSHTFVKFTNFQPSFFFSLLFFLSLFYFLWKMCVEFGQTRGREGRGRWEGDSKGNCIEPTYSPPSLHRLLPPFLPPAPERSPRRSKVPQHTLSLFSLLPNHPSVGQKNNLSPSFLPFFPSLVPLLPWCAGRIKKG